MTEFEQSMLKMAEYLESHAAYLRRKAAQHDNSKEALLDITQRTTLLINNIRFGDLVHSWIDEHSMNN